MDDVRRGKISATWQRPASGGLHGLPFREHVGKRLGGERRAQLIDGGIHRLLELSGGGLLARTPLQRLDGDDDVEQGDLTGRLGECDAAAVAATRVSPPRRMDWRTLARRSPARDYDGCKLNRIHRCRHRRGEFLKASQALALRFANNPTTKCAGASVDKAISRYLWCDLASNQNCG